MGARGMKEPVAERRSDSARNARWVEKPSDGGGGTSWPLDTGSNV